MLLVTRIRKQNGWSQSVLSHRSGVHVSTISNIERGRLIPWPGQRARIAQAVGWPADRADELFEEVQDAGDAD